MTASATTVAPVAPGSATMHEVPLPIDKRSTATGTESKPTGNGANQNEPAFGRSDAA